MANKLMAILVFFLAMVCSSLNVGSELGVPAVYIFGDSTFDVGTNSFLSYSSSRADMQFYGIDFPFSKPTGRFSNGYNTADRIVNFLGYTESPLPFLYLVQNDTQHFKREILKGVNFASGGSGLQHQTGRRFNRVIPIAEQIQQFKTVISNISVCLNDTRINKSFFLISVGSNDIFEFFDNLSKSNPSNITLEVPEFLVNLMNNYEAHLKSLLNLGARKFGILSVPPLGCVPILRSNASDGKCLEGLNAIARLFHTALGAVLRNLNSEFLNMKYSLANTYDITCSMIDNPTLFGLQDVKSACCGNQTLSGGTPCSPDAEVCENRNLFLFWDQYHPTDYVATLAAFSVYSGGTEYVAPMNFSVLFQE